MLTTISRTENNWKRETFDTVYTTQRINMQKLELLGGSCLDGFLPPGIWCHIMATCCFASPIQTIYLSQPFPTLTAAASNHQENKLSATTLLPVVVDQRCYGRQQTQNEFLMSIGERIRKTTSPPLLTYHVMARTFLTSKTCYFSQFEQATDVTREVWFFEKIMANRKGQYGNKPSSVQFWSLIAFRQTVTLLGSRKNSILSSYENTHRFYPSNLSLCVRSSYQWQIVNMCFSRAINAAEDEWNFSHGILAKGGFPSTYNLILPFSACYLTPIVDS